MIDGFHSLCHPQVLVSYGVLYPPIIHVLWSSISTDHSCLVELYVRQSFPS